MNASMVVYLVLSQIKNHGHKFTWCLRIIICHFTDVLTVNQAQGAYTVHTLFLCYIFNWSTSVKKCFLLALSNFCYLLSS